MTIPMRYAKYEEYTNTHVEWREANDTYKEKLGLVLMDKDNMPMILTGSGETDCQCGGSGEERRILGLSSFKGFGAIPTYPRPMRIS